MTLLYGAPGADTGSTDRPKQPIPDTISLAEVHTLLQAVNIILNDADPSVQLTTKSKNRSQP
ncbi:MAG: hypothetical protein JSS07_05245 [Proteobacteria bacterium]|nr:hypothetical protein [Pseudomonadota bacterium]